MSKRIEKKTWPEEFKEILEGNKTFDARLADWNCARGDTLVLKEWNPGTKKYTGREIKKMVTFVTKTKNFKFFSKKDVDEYGFQIIGFK